VDAAIELLKNPKAADHKILVIVSNPSALLKVVTQVADIPLVNVGNYGRVAPKANGEPRKTYRKNLYAYDNEIMDLKKVVETGIKCNYQTVPDDTPEELLKVLS
jgi:PTS system mannose-specific IIB component